MHLNGPETELKCSPVPDLIYHLYRDRRIQQVLPVFKNQSIQFPDDWHRLTVFATFRCNLDCRYCKTSISKSVETGAARAPDLSLHDFSKMLQSLLIRPLRHIHFTGGEATLNRELPQMVMLAGQNECLTSLTSNGLAPSDIYTKLVECGLNEIRISVDSYEPELLKDITGRSSQLPRLIKNIKHLTKLRRNNNGRPFIILNVCVGEYNQNNLPELLKHCFALQPDDIKLLPVSSDDLPPGAIAPRYAVRAKTEQILSGYGPSQFPLLRLKLAQLFREDSNGLQDISARQLMRHCFIPLTERIIDARFYYPCSVYLREGGQPLGNWHQESLATQQQKIQKFVRGTDCREDPICQEYCLGCTRKFNLNANLQMYNTVVGKRGEAQKIDIKLNCPVPVKETEIQHCLQLFEEERQKNVLLNTTEPFLVIKPEGLSFQVKIENFLEQKGVRIKKRIPIPDWNLTTMYYYGGDRPNTSRIRRGLIIKNTLPAYLKSQQALLLILESNFAPEKLLQWKQELREYLTPNYCLIRYEDELVITELNYVHV